MFSLVATDHLIMKLNFKDCQCIHIIFLPWEKDWDSSYSYIWPPYSKEYLVVTLKLVPWFWRRKYLNVFQVSSLFYHFLLEKRVTLENLTNLWLRQAKHSNIISYESLNHKGIRGYVDSYVDTRMYTRAVEITSHDYPWLSEIRLPFCLHI